MNYKSESSKFKINKYKLIKDKFGNNFQDIFPKKINKISKIIHTSDVSTTNTNTNSDSHLNENNQTNINENININNPEIITNKFNIAFKALEQLILDDENNDNNNNNEETILKKNSTKKNCLEESNSKNDLNIKKAQFISIPKLDFSDIFDNYNNSPVYIREIINKKNCFTNDIKAEQN